MGTSRGKPRHRRHLTVKKPRHSVRWLAQGHTACDREAGTRPCLSGASHASRFPGRREEAAASSSFLEAHCHFALPDVFMTQFSALQTARSVRTRRLAAAEENVEVARAARLAQILKEICDGIISYKGDRGPRMLFVAVLNTRVTCPHRRHPGPKTNGRSGLGIPEATQFSSHRSLESGPVEVFGAVAFASLDLTHQFSGQIFVSVKAVDPFPTKMHVHNFARIWRVHRP